MALLGVGPPETRAEFPLLPVTGSRVSLPPEEWREAAQEAGSGELEGNAVASVETGTAAGGGAGSGVGGFQMRPAEPACPWAEEPSLPAQLGLRGYLGSGPAPSPAARALAGRRSRFSLPQSWGRGLEPQRDPPPPTAHSRLETPRSILSSPRVGRQEGAPQDSRPGCAGPPPPARSRVSHAIFRARP